MKDTTGDLFQAAGQQAPFSFVVVDAEMSNNIFIIQPTEAEQEILL